MEIEKIMKTSIQLLILCIFIFGYSFGAMSGTDGPEIGEDAPDFVLKSIDGKEVKLSSFKSVKPVVLIFGSCT